MTLLDGESLQLNPGDRVEYLRESRGGYGLVARLPAIVIRKTPSGRYTVRLNSGRTVTVSRMALAAERK